MALPWAAIAKGVNNAGETNGKKGGGIGNALSASKDSVFSLATGGIQAIQAHKLKKEAAAAMPGFNDPMQMAFLSQLNQQRRSLDTGSAYAAGMNAIGASTAGADQGILQAGAGNVGGTIQGLLQAQRVGSDQQNQVLANGEQQNMQYNNMYGELLDKVAGRKLQLQLLNHNELMGQWATKQKAASSNIMAGLARMNSPLKNNTSGGAQTAPPEEYTQSAQTIQGGGVADSPAPEGTTTSAGFNGFSSSAPISTV